MNAALFSATVLLILVIDPFGNVPLVVAALKKHPKFNSSLNEVTESLILKHYFHIGIAVDTDVGLLVPVLLIAARPLVRPTGRISLCLPWGRFS